MEINKFIKNILPPFLINILRKIKGYGWYGNYKTYKEAKKKTTGYDNNIIIEKIRESALKVRDGKAIYERDGVLFDKIEYSLPLLAGLMYGAAKSKGKLCVCDFGGSLGTTYYQNKKFLDGLKHVVWCIVEQKHFVDVGKLEFENEIVKFYYDIMSCKKDKNPDILLLSVVLQYIEKPYELLNNLLNYNFNLIIIDNIPFLDKDSEDIIKIQIVPEHIYKASYPCWIFNKNKMIGYFQNRGYKILEIFDSYLNNYGKYGNFTFQSLIIEKGNV